MLCVNVIVCAVCRRGGGGGLRLLSTDCLLIFVSLHLGYHSFSYMNSEWWFFRLLGLGGGGGIDVGSLAPRVCVSGVNFAHTLPRLLLSERGLVWVFRSVCLNERGEIFWRVPHIG